MRPPKGVAPSDILPALGDLKAKEVTRGDVKRLLRGIADRGSPVAAHRTGALISRIFTFGITEDLVDVNPAVRLPRFTEEESRRRVLSDAEIAAVWRALQDEHPVTRGAIRFLMLCGQRRGEVLELQWGGARADYGAMVVGAAGGAHQERTGAPSAHLGTGSGDPRGDEAVRVAVGVSWKGGFNDDGSARDIPITDLRPAIRRACKATGVERFTPHDLRRTMLTGLASMGFPQDVRKAVANHVGRQDVSHVYDRYDRAPEKRKALDAWGRRVMAAVRGEKRNVLEFTGGASEERDQARSCSRC